MKPIPRSTFLPVSLLTAAVLWAGTASAEVPAVEGVTPLDCVINPSVVADLGSGVPGILSAVKVDRSDLVEQGQVVAELESSVEALALELARARAEADAEVDLRRVNAAFGQRQHKRTEDLYRRKVISTNDMDERQTEARLASLQLRQAIENQELARLEERRAEKVLHRRAIESPITGVVMERFKTIGEYVEDQPVLRVAQLDPLHVEVFVPVEQLGAVSQGMQAEVWSELVPGANWTARVSRIDRVADVASGTYGVRLELPNPDYKVPAGLRCRVRFTDTPAVPAVAAGAAVDAEQASASAATDAATDGRATTGLANRAPMPRVAGTDVVESAAVADRAAAPALDPKHVEGQAVGPGGNPAVVPALAAVTPALPAVQTSTAPGVAQRDAAMPPMPVPAAVDADAPGAVTATPVTAASVAHEVTPGITTAATKPAGDNLSTEPLPGKPHVSQQGMLTAETTTDASLAAVAALPRCQLAGPFADKATATRKARALADRGLEVRVEERTTTVQAGLRVLSPAMPTRAAAEDLYQRLQAAGFVDLYLAPRGKYRDRVALGLYKHDRPARERVEEIRAKGFEAELLPWLKRDTEYFLAIRVVPGDETAALVGALPVPATDGAFESSSCDRLASR